MLQSMFLTSRDPPTGAGLEPLAGFEQQNRHLAQVEVNEVLRLMRYVATEVPAHDAVPGGVVFLVKFLGKKQKREGKVKTSGFVAASSKDRAFSDMQSSLGL